MREALAVVIILKLDLIVVVVARVRVGPRVEARVDPVRRRVERVAGGAAVDFGTIELAAVEFGSIELANDDGGQGFGPLRTEAVASLLYLGATGCDATTASVGFLGPWFRDNAKQPSQAWAEYPAACGAADVGDCVYGAGCGPQRVLLTVGGNTTRRTPGGGALWNNSVG